MIDSDVRPGDRVRVAWGEGDDRVSLEGTVLATEAAGITIRGYGRVSRQRMGALSVKVLKCAPIDEPPGGSVVVVGTAVFARPVWDQTGTPWMRLCGDGSRAWYAWAEILEFLGRPRLVDLAATTTDYPVTHTQDPADIYRELSGFLDRLVMSAGEREALKAVMVHYGTARYREGWNHRGAGHAPDGGPDR